MFLIRPYNSHASKRLLIPSGFVAAQQQVPEFPESTEFPDLPKFPKGVCDDHKEECEKSCSNKVIHFHCHSANGKTTSHCECNASTNQISCDEFHTACEKHCDTVMIDSFHCSYVNGYANSQCKCSCERKKGKAWFHNYVDQGG